MAIEVRFGDGSTGDIEITDAEFDQLIAFARRGIRISVPVGQHGALFFISIIDVRRVLRPDENIDYAQLSALGGKNP